MSVHIFLCDIVINSFVATWLQSLTLIHMLKVLKYAADRLLILTCSLYLRIQRVRLSGTFRLKLTLSTPNFTELNGLLLNISYIHRVALILVTMACFFFFFLFLFFVVVVVVVLLLLLLLLLLLILHLPFTIDVKGTSGFSKHVYHVTYLSSHQQVEEANCIFKGNSVKAKMYKRVPGKIKRSRDLRGGSREVELD